MRAKRQVRPPPSGFSLALPLESARKEVHVQQRDEHEVKQFFIHVDDTLVSPMITTGSSSLFCSTAVPTGDEDIHARTVPVSSVPVVDPSAPYAAGVSGSFIHVNNTNLFVLMDGISMFIEGKSTFTGGDDSWLLQHIQERKKAARPKDVLPDNDAVAVRARPSAPGCPPSGDVDTVEEAIRGIEQQCSGSFSCGSQSSSNKAAALPVSMQKGPGSLLSSQGSPSTSSSPSSLGHRFPSEFTALFNNARKPASTPLFRNQVASPLPDNIPKEWDKNALCRSFHEVPVSTSLVSLSTESSVVPTMEKSFDANNGGAAVIERPSNASRKRGMAGGTGGGGKSKLYSSVDVGLSNRSLNLEDVEILNFIGCGSQGKVYRVMLDSKLYALKNMDVREATQSPNAVERQGRKRGLVKELNMMRLQRERPQPLHLMQMFNAVATFSDDRQQLSMLMELMSFSVEDAQKMVARMPTSELMKTTQSTFKAFMAGDNRSSAQLDYLIKHRHGSCMHLLGRMSYNAPEEWEGNVERQTPMPEIVLSMLALDVLKGLHELHNDYGIVHCDLKPANILLGFDKKSFKLADFGCGCVMDRATGVVRRTGVDLGSKLYKAPERVTSVISSDASGRTSSFEETSGELDDVVQFTAKADVWSLGITLLELASGVHPCDSFKSDFWNYLNLLKLSKMIKPLTWSSALCDFILRCLYVDVKQRWSVAQLLQHPFIIKFEGVSRLKLKMFMERLANESATFQRRKQRELLQQQILLSTTQRAKDTYQTQSRMKWRGFTGFLSVTPKLSDTTMFPQLH